MPSHTLLQQTTVNFNLMYSEHSPATPIVDEDAPLVRRFVHEHDERAFEAIVTKYKTFLHCTAFQLLRNHWDAEEVVSSVFASIARRLAYFRGDSTLKTLLYRATRNKATQRYYYFRADMRDTLITDALDAPIDDTNENSGTMADLLADAQALTPRGCVVSEEISGIIHECLGGALVRQSRDSNDARSEPHVLPGNFQRA